MVEVQMRRSDAAGVHVIARLQVEDDRLTVNGDLRALDFNLPVPDLRRLAQTGDRRRLHFRENPQEWARNLHAVYRSGELMAVTVHDTDPLPEPPTADRQSAVVAEPQRTGTTTV